MSLSSYLIGNIIDAFAVNFGLILCVVAVQSCGRRGVTYRETVTVSWSRGVLIALVARILAERRGIPGLMPGKGIVFFSPVQP